jgi:hypothetical protein
MLWNPPYYGYAEPLQYLPRHTEQYTVSKWTKVVTWGSIKGTVRANGAPRAVCAVQSKGRSSSVRRVAVSSTGCRPYKIASTSSGLKKP